MMGYDVERELSITKTGERQIVTFKLNQEQFAIDIQNVREIVTNLQITHLPAAPPTVMGTIYLRQQVIPVLNLKQRLKMKNIIYEPHCPIIILQNGRGVLVDEMMAVIRIHETQIEESMDTAVQEVKGEVIKMTDTLISLLDPKKIIDADEVLELVETVDDETTPSRQQKQALTVEQFVGFSIQDDVFAIRVKEVQEINKLVSIRYVPRAPRFVEGVINLRGQIIPVLNLRERFDLETIEYDKHTRIIVTNLNQRRVGLIVDAIVGVLRIATSEIKDPPSDVVGHHLQFIEGFVEIDQNPIVILDLSQVLSRS